MTHIIMTIINFLDMLRVFILKHSFYVFFFFLKKNYCQIKIMGEKKQQTNFGSCQEWTALTSDINCNSEPNEV